MNTRKKQQVPTAMDLVSNASGRSNTRGASGLAAFRRARSPVAVSQSPSASATSQSSQPQPQPQLQSQQRQSQQRTPAQAGWKPKAKNPFGFNRPPLEPSSSTTSKGAVTTTNTATQAPKTKLTKVVEEPSLSSCSSSTSVQNNNNSNNNSNSNNNNSNNNSQRGTATVNPLAKYHTIDDSAQCQAALVAKLENVEFDRRRAMSETLATHRPTQSSGGVPNAGPGMSSLLRRRFLFFGSTAGGSSSNTAKDGQQQQQQQQQQAKVDTNEIKQVVKNENETLKARVARLEMDQVELKALRYKITQLEWALDVVREDADKVRDDARSLLMQLQQHGKHDREWDEFDEERDASTVGKDHVNDDISRTPIPHH